MVRSRFQELVPTLIALGVAFTAFVGCAVGDSESSSSGDSSGDSSADTSTSSGSTSSGGGMGAGGATGAGGAAATTTGSAGDPCQNGVKDGAESDVDCGGGTCPTCADGATCNDPADCSTGSCSSGICGPPGSTCGNNKKDGDEFGIDCGGSCPACPTTSCEGGGIGTGNDCGPNDEDCCTKTLVPGGTYNRSQDPQFPATVSSFYVEKYETTVGRFRNFVKSGYGTQQNPPAAGAGAHKLIPNSGWDPAWNGDLESNPQTFRSALKCGAAGIYTWSDAPGSIEDEPICCETWYEAFAFCAWQGGRLPTEAELHYLQVGGSEQRPYPWGLGPPTNISYTVYDCIYDGSAAGQCAGSDLPPVGSVSPLGDGKWGQVDLTGSVVEWVRDTFKAQMLKPCADCARMEDPLVNGIVSRGGAYKNQAPFLAMSGQSARLKIEPDFRTHCAYGIRCAFDP